MMKFYLPKLEDMDQVSVQKVEDMFRSTTEPHQKTEGELAM